MSSSAKVLKPSFSRRGNRGRALLRAKPRLVRHDLTCENISLQLHMEIGDVNPVEPVEGAYCRCRGVANLFCRTGDDFLDVRSGRARVWIYKRAAAWRINPRHNGGKNPVARAQHGIVQRLPGGRLDL